MVLSILKSRLIFIVSTILLSITFILLSFISTAGLYKTVIGENVKIIGQTELQKAPWIIVISLFTFWVIIPVMWRIFIEKNAFNKLGLSFGNKPILSWIIAIILSIIIGFIASFGDSQTSNNSTNSIIFIIFTLNLIAFTEEFLLRFFIAGRIAKIGSINLAIVISSLFFTFLHFQAPVHSLIPYLIFVFGTGIYLSFLFFHFNSIWICIISHFVINFVSNLF